MGSKKPGEPLSDAIEDVHTYVNCRKVPMMRRFVSDPSQLAKLDQLLRQLKNDGHRVLLYPQMTRMMDLMEEYLNYWNYKYV